MIKKILFISFILTMFFSCGNSQKANQAMIDGKQAFDNGEYDNAIAHYNIALQNFKLDKELSDVYLELAKTYAAKINPGPNMSMPLYDSTMVNFKYALQHCASDSQLIKVHSVKGKIKHYLGDMQGAIASFQQVINLTEDNMLKARSYLNIGDALKAIGKDNDAIKSFEQAIKLTDDKEIHAIVEKNLGEIHALKGNYKIALENFGKALITYPENEDKGLVCINMASIYDIQGRHKEAIEKYEQAIRLLKNDMNLTDAFNGLGTIHFKRQEYKEADSLFLQALELAPLNPQRLINYGFSRLYLNDIDSAFSSFARAIEKDDRLKRTLATSGEIHRWISENKQQGKEVRLRLDEIIKPFVISHDK